MCGREGKFGYIEMLLNVKRCMECGVVDGKCHKIAGFTACLTRLNKKNIGYYDGDCRLTIMYRGLNKKFCLKNLKYFATFIWQALGGCYW